MNETKNLNPAETSNIMEKRVRCVSCGNHFEERKERKSIKVTLSNPGDVFCEGNISTCPHCGEEYADEEDLFKIAESFDKAHAEKYNNFKKEVLA